MFFQKQKQDFWRDITTFGGAYFYFTLVLLFFAVGKTNFALKLTAGFFVIYFTAIIIRLFYFKNRPKKESYDNLLGKIDASSFPSVHSARVVFLALTLSEFSDSFQVKVSLLLFIIAGAVCYSRIAIKKHYWIDVNGGIFLGQIRRASCRERV